MSESMKTPAAVLIDYSAIVTLKNTAGGIPERTRILMTVDLFIIMRVNLALIAMAMVSLIRAMSQQPYP